MIARFTAFALLLIAASYVSDAPAQAEPEGERYYIFNDAQSRAGVFPPGRKLILGTWYDSNGSEYYAAIGLNLPRLYEREVGRPFYDKTYGYYYFSEAQVNIARRNQQILREEIEASRNRRDRSSCDGTLRVRDSFRPKLTNGNRQ